MAVRIWTILSLLLLVAVKNASAATMMSAAEVTRLQESKAAPYLIDTRSPQAFARKHIAGAINIPAYVVHRKGLAKGESIVVYDGGIGTVEAAQAAEKLETAGYGKVALLEGGLAAWEAAGYPIAAPAGVLSDSLVEVIHSDDLARINRNLFELILVDLRDEQSFKAGTIPDARNIAPESLLAASSGWNRQAVIVLFDGGTANPEKMAEQLRRAGFKLIRFLYGGYPAWKHQN